MGVKQWVLIGALAVLLVGLVGWYGWQLGPWGDAGENHGRVIDFATLERASTPNQFLMAPPGATPRAVPDATSPEFAVPPERLRDAFLEVVREQPRTRMLERSDDGMRFTVVHRSLVMRFPDYAAVAILPTGEGGSTLAVYSRSRFGHSDFGVNRRRVEGWVAALRQRVGG